MKILVKFPIRDRREKFFKTLGLYCSMADDLDQIRFVISMDEDDPEMNNKAVMDILNDIPNLEYHYGHSRTKIEACNADVPPDGWDILLLASDDMIPVVKGWDTIVRQEMEQHFPNLDGVLHHWDGHQKDHINTLSIMGRNWYRRWGYIYHPAYRTMWCDTEYTEVSRMFGKEQYFKQVIIEHQHPYSGAIPMDDLYHRNNDASFDSQLYQRRKANNFYLHSMMIIQQGRVGDILICLPIAKHFSEQNIMVYWLCNKEYHNLFRGIDYATPITQPIKTSHVLDLSFGWGGTPVQGWWDRHQKDFFSFVEAKYHLAGVNLQKRWNLEWRRDFGREIALYDRLVPESKDGYILTQEDTHLGQFITCSFPNQIKLHQVEDFSIFDWYEIIRGASEIHCIDSALSNFIEACPEFWGIKKHIYLRAREKDSDYFLRSIYRNNWIYEQQTN